MTADSQFTTVMLQVARGERPLVDLALIGVELTPSRSGYRIRRAGDNSSGQTIPVSLEDVAQGLLTHHSDVDALRAWATLLLVHDAFEVPEEEHEHPDFNAIWGAVWDASFSGRVKAEALRSAQRLVRQTDDISLHVDDK